MMYNESEKWRKRTVAVYARVSTEHEAQISALENQKQYYNNIIDNQPEWTLYKFYVDEGITGTSTRKRKGFLEMMADAEAGRFDLIITREVSRFARNTVDTLTETRKLKKIGVEVWFTSDNIWTISDQDGELRLTIMATLAQNESKKTSDRVKAGQMVSFQNAVPYGNGNILGYDKLPNHGGYVINPEQADTVRKIYQLYIAGYGEGKIATMMEQEGRKTATGLSRWQSANIGRILHNPFYCGTIVYRKQYVPDYLEQKKINNFGEVENIVVEGKHEPIISKEDYAIVQELLKSKSVVKKGFRKPNNPAKFIWCKKLICPCGSSFNHKSWHKVRGEKTFAYQCYQQIKYGTRRVREKKGLSLDGVCETPMVQEWKLNTMLMFIFNKFWEDKQEVIDLCNEMLDEEFVSQEDIDIAARIQKCNNTLERLKNQSDQLLSMCLDQIITRAEYIIKKEEIEDKILKTTSELKMLSEEYLIDEERRNQTLKVIKYGIEQDFKFDIFNIPDEVIDAFVESVVVHPDYFEWHLNLRNLQQDIVVEGDLRKSKVYARQAHTSNKDSTGSYRKQVMLSFS